MVQIQKIEKKAKAKLKKVAFKVTHEVHQKFDTLVKEAKAAGYRVDFNNDFVKWFKGQLTALEKHIKGEPPKKGKTTTK